MSAPAQAAARPPRPPAGGGGFFGRGPMGGIGMPAEKAMTFKPSAQRLMRRLGGRAHETSCRESWDSTISW